jgi:hypothetical protein
MTRVRAASPASLPAPSLIACSFRILLVKLQLRLLGFDRTWAIVRRRAEPRGDGAPARAHEDLTPSLEPGHEAVEYRVALASALYPGRALCLERSLVLYHYLRRARIPVQFRLGVQPYPFAAHAWVERDGVPINDVPEHVAYFTPVDAVGGSTNERGTR